MIDFIKKNWQYCLIGLIVILFLIVLNGCKHIYETQEKTQISIIQYKNKTETTNLSNQIKTIQSDKTLLDEKLKKVQAVVENIDTREYFDASTGKLTLKEIINKSNITTTTTTTIVSTNTILQTIIQKVVETNTIFVTTHTTEISTHELVTKYSRTAIMLGVGEMGLFNDVIGSVGMQVDRYEFNADYGIIKKQFGLDVKTTLIEW